jgi:hypothetical protein
MRGGHTCPLARYLFLPKTGKMSRRTGRIISVAKENGEKGGVMEAVMEQGKTESLKDRVCRAMKPICNCISVAAQQAREAEIDVPLKRHFRQRVVSGETSSALPEDAGTRLHEVVARTQIGVATFLHCLDDAKRQVEQSRTDAGKRPSFRRLPE